MTLPLRRPQYRLVTLFAVISAISVALGLRSVRERQYQRRCEEVVTLVKTPGAHVWAEDPAGARDSWRDLALGGDTLRRDEIVVGVDCALGLGKGDKSNYLTGIAVGMALAGHPRTDLAW